MEGSAIVSLYVVQCVNGLYLAGFNAEQQRAVFVDDPLFAKKFSNKNDIKLRPEELVVELTVDLESTDVSISEPFRPFRKKRPVPQ